MLAGNNCSSGVWLWGAKYRQQVGSKRTGVIRGYLKRIPYTGNFCIGAGGRRGFHDMFSQSRFKSSTLRAFLGIYLLQATPVSW